MKENLKHNKIVMASKMFEESVNRFLDAKADIDYVTSILLSGAVIGISAPLLEEKGGNSVHGILSLIGNKIDDKVKHHKGLYRSVYNSLKHSGNKKSNTKPSEDLEFVGSLRQEAARMLDAAKDDFKGVIVYLDNDLLVSKSFLELLQSDCVYAR